MRFTYSSGLVLAATFAILFGACTCGGGVGTGDACRADHDCGAGFVCGDGACVARTGLDGGGDPDGGDPDGGGNADSGTQCVNLQCQQQTCEGTTKTRITGKVFAPNGTLPLYNATVYVPNAPVQPFTPGVTCDRCGALSGSPVVSALTGPDGSFTLENVPAGSNIPLVIQMGRWRRQIVIPEVPACQTLALTDPQVTRLPRTQEEGEIPQMAIATGSADPFECLLRKVGIADSEFTLPSGTGRVHYFRANGINMNPPAPAGSTLWDDLKTLEKYDVVMLPCEGAENIKSQAATQNIIDYTNAGGRLFATHYSYVWIAFAQAPFPLTGEWNTARRNPPDPFTVTLDESFPKGAAFADWLVNVNASTTRGQLNIIQGRHNLDAVNPDVAQRWFYGTNSNEGGASTVQHYTFNTPVAALLPDGGAPDQCGRVVFSDFHVSAAALSGQTTFPGSCLNNGLSAQEKALAFMLFDLSNCVQRDEVPPVIN